MGGSLGAGNDPGDGEEMVILREASVEKAEILIDFATGGCGPLGPARR